MRSRYLLVAAIAAIFFTAAAPAAAPAATEAAPKIALPGDHAQGWTNTTADHSKFQVLDQDFASGQAVTKACLSCHTEASKQIHKTTHWKWEYKDPATGQLLGKKNVVNNFCTSVRTNEAACASCHIGMGMVDDKFDFSSEVNVDCLVCHDNTQKYTKPGGFGGAPVAKDTEYPPGSGKIVRGTNLKEIAQKVGKTTRDTCGGCHFKGGGGDGVKHGDLDSSLSMPSKELDVHMDAEGLNFSCTTCHKTDGHDVSGSRYAPTAKDKGPAHIRGEADKTKAVTCQECHGQAPHKVVKLNEHTAKIACQTCHIPAFARGGVPTKMSWDWSTAGKLGPDGKFQTLRDENDYDTYMTIKGDFKWAENVTPEYIWMNGVNKYTLITDKLEKADQPIKINNYEGSATDGKSMIWPIKLFTGKQQYDPVNKTLVITHLAGNDDTAYWKNLNWEKAVTEGMTKGGVKFSGKVDFIETQSMWPTTHMVAPKEKALGCVECHASKGRLDKIDGVYMPGRTRDHARWLEIGGWLVAALVLLGVLGHGLIRIVANKRNR
ncbi:MAG: tetrathionate reductase family octaheme c-type cytochrome [Rhodoferax sp.]|uniref:tetrathionate reductase family octaheme c-type cytochrome n=1 Tax=Rhodoferax sp. TaxID=50421 RepID=UPI0013FE6DB3|nr:tetrathionate reductase family octaheme c-type cytochrome [Rhodoferax sp.]NDP37907.1 tetrathionate reductase family octaheme c-type cytochrome [Rhodoferax sp.]